MSKKTIVILGVAFVLVFFIGFLIGDSSAIARVNEMSRTTGSSSLTDYSTPPITPTTAPVVTTPPPAPVVTPTDKLTMTMAKFTQLKDGMSYEDATKIIGEPGEVASESGTKGDALHTIMYQYNGEGDIGANANLMFQGDKLINKAQFGLK